MLEPKKEVLKGGFSTKGIISLDQILRKIYEEIFIQVI
jgi:hypothetical protein